MTVIDVFPPAQPPLPSANTDTNKFNLHTPLQYPSMEGHFDISPAASLRLSEADNGGVAGAGQGRKPKMGVKQSPGRGRRKSRWKLKFHHQALPPEYLKHYKQQEKKRRLTENRLKVKKAVKKPEESTEPEFPTIDSLLRTPTQDSGVVECDEFNFLDGESPQLGIEGEEVKNEARRLEQKFREGIWPTPGLLGDSFPNLNIDLSQNKAFLENLLSNQIEINRVDRQEKIPTPIKPPKPPKVKAIPSSGRIMNYSDLPYMGEITLDGIKPRRGRKPKKADICHLIYKNYGQIFPGAPNSVVEKPPPKEPKLKASPRVPPVTATSIRPHVESPLPTVSGLINHTEVQNRIINSLLEKRLTQEARGKPESFTKLEVNFEEPLNLCLRDLKSLKIKLSRKHGNIYETKSPEFQNKPQDVEIKKEVIDLESEDENSAEDVDLTPFNLVTTELRDSSDDESCVSLGNQVTLTKLTDKTPLPSPTDPTMFWPGSNYFCPSMPLFPELYYQKLNSAKPPVIDKKPKSIKPKPNKRMPPRTDTNAAQVIAKRKRSAIFIPPVPPDNTSNPTTEVSICKFKFTGGAKPSLQEKKMLSVDAGGNFRYYSGTGDKSMRGYEYFPRESLQQCQEYTGCSPSGVFLTASALGSGEKIPEEVGQSNFFDSTFNVQMPSPAAVPTVKKSKSKKAEEGTSMMREHMTDSLEEDDSEESSLGTAPSPGAELLRDENSPGDEISGRRPRRSRKSLAREKLEQTFKEKGFLIQTQQLESAEGATYCKFRQLRKFTRYLFRSWKDYLPGNVRDMSLDAGVAPLEIPEPNVSPSSISPLSPPIKLEPPAPIMDS